MPPPRNVVYQSHPQRYEKLIILKCLSQYFLRKSAWFKSIKFLKTGEIELSLLGANNGVHAIGLQIVYFSMALFYLNNA